MMNLESAIMQENELREQLSELGREIQAVRDRLRAAKDNGDALTFTDATDELADLEKERARLRRALRLAGEERVKATQAERKREVQSEIAETQAALASVFSGPLPGIEELQTAISAFDCEAFKQAAVEKLQEAGPLIGKLRAYQVAYRAPWNSGSVEDLVHRINLTRALLNTFTGS
jgi:chromosome segregation ATPase